MKNKPTKSSGKPVRKAAVKSQDENNVQLEPQQFNNVLETLPCYLILLTPDYHVVFANKFFRERFGESHGKRCYEYLFNRTEPCEVCETYKVLQKMKPLEWEWLGPDGHNYYIYDFPFKATDGSTLIMEVGIDITIQKKALAELSIARDELEMRIQERTRELKEVNRLLRVKASEHKQAEEREKRTAEEWQTTFDSITDMVSIQDKDCRLVRVNKAYADAVGMSREELNGQKCYAVIHRAECPIENCPHQETLETHQTVTREIFEPRLGLYLEVTTSPVFNEAGEITGSVHIAKDITERKRAEEALRESQHDLNRAQAVARTGSWRMDVRHNTLSWSDETYRLFGIPIGTPMTFESFLAAVHPEDREYVEGKWLAALLGETYDIEHRIIVGNDIKWVREKAEMEFDQNKILVGGFGTIQDITELEKTENAFRETRDYLENLIGCANAPIIVWNPQLKITRFNHAFERLTGRTKDEILGQKLDILFPDASREASMKLIHKTTVGQRWEVVEIPIIHRNGMVHIVLWNSATLYAPDGKTPVATIAQGQDITELKKTDKMKDEFIGLVSHELRTPLTVITGSLRTAMSEGLSPEEVRELIQNATEGADQLASILENMLELSRYQAGHLKLRMEPVSIAGTTRNLVKKLKGQGVSQQFMMDIPKDLPPVEADPMRVERILYNLLENATKYSSPGSQIEVSARTEGDFVISSVTDQGPGISPDDQGRLFELFQQLETSQRPTSGVGLGLVVVKRLAEAQGGWIKVDSTPGKGSTFSFALPKSELPS
jgi:PAS domain S-box-containing protein